MRAGLLLLIGAAGCALLGKNDPQVPRYYTPEYEAGAPAARARSDLLLRLGRVEGWAHLRERMAVRSSARELTYSEDRRWTERPEIYLRRALSRALFEEQGVVESLSGQGFTLDVELIAFEEVEQPHTARLEALLILRDNRVALLQETVTVVQPVEPVKGEEPAGAVAGALSRALHSAVTRIADRVVARLSGEAGRAAR